jgi:hypothetical protein
VELCKNFETSLPSHMLYDMPPSETMIKLVLE